MVAAAACGLVSDGIGLISGQVADSEPDLLQDQNNPSLMTMALVQLLQDFFFQII
jgi:hypothetical protein